MAWVGKNNHVSRWYGETGRQITDLCTPAMVANLERAGIARKAAGGWMLTPNISTSHALAVAVEDRRHCDARR
jgi:hypothetical protein